MKLSPSEVRDIAAVLQAWSHADDWNVDSIYIDMARELISDLAAGDNPVTLIRAAERTGPWTPIERDTIPHFIAREERNR